MMDNITTNQNPPMSTVPHLPRDRPLTNEEKLQFELYEKDLRNRLKNDVIKENNGKYALRMDGKFYKFKYTS